MSQEDIRDKAKRTWKNAEDLVAGLTDSAHRELSETAPKLTNALDEQFDNAAKAFSKAMNDIDKKTAKEQGDLLRAYRSFLQKQTEMIDRRLNEKRDQLT